MFEENLQLNASSFGFSRRSPQPKPIINDIAPSRSAYIEPRPEPIYAQAKPEPTIANRPLAVPAAPDAVDLPDFLLRPPAVPASPRAFKLRKAAVCALVTALAGAGLVAALGIFGTNQFAHAAKLIPLINSSNNFTAKPSALAVSSYQVSADKPRYIDIGFLKIHARVQGASFTKSGNLSSPINRYDTAWDGNSSKPGEQGAMVVGSSAAGCVNPGIFYNLKKIVLGSDIVITSGDGTTFDYKVIKTQTYSKSQVNDDLLSAPSVHGRPGLNIITCAGQQDTESGDFNQRLLVNAVLY